VIAGLVEAPVIAVPVGYGVAQGGHVAPPQRARHLRYGRRRGEHRQRLRRGLRRDPHPEARRLNGAPTVAAPAYSAVFRDRNLTVILLLGFASGLPLALTGGTLQAWMTVEGVSLATIGIFTLVGIPYTWKFLWSPLMDAVPPFLGRGGRARHHAARHRGPSR
jgi:hypothetical protein